MLTRPPVVSVAARTSGHSLWRGVATPALIAVAYVIPWVAVVGLSWLAATPLGAEPPTSHVTPRLLAEHGPAKLWQVGEHRLLLVAGTPREMGFQQGTLLAAECRENLRLFLDDFAIKRLGNTRDELAKLWDQAAPNIPHRYHEELAGIAQASGIALRELQLLHIIPEKHHCTGAAVFGPATADGKLHHTRSLDFPLTIGADRTAQDNAVVVVYKPSEGVAHINVSWAGFAGSVTGMNAAGISVGEMGCFLRDETFDGLPMIFLLREVLYGAETLDQAVEIMRRAPRTAGYNFIFADGKAPNPSAVALEVGREAVRVFTPGGAEENIPPHTAIPFCVRRCNHFVDRQLAAGQRDVYDPRLAKPASWLGYYTMTEFLKVRHGQLDAATMIAMLRGYPPPFPCLHQAVFTPGDRDIYVAVAKNPRRVSRAGAQNQTFYKYNLTAVLGGEPGAIALFAPPPQADTKTPPTPDDSRLSSSPSTDDQPPTPKTEGGAFPVGTP